MKNISNKNLVVANWKMNPNSLVEARRLASQVEHGLLSIDRTKVDIVICPPVVFLPVVKHALHFGQAGVQNISAEEKGAFTGQISATQVLEFRVKYAIIGHSECRLFGESDQVVNKKVKISVAHGIEPILCVGYGLKPSSSLLTVKKVIKKQLQVGLAGIDLRKYLLTIAYEPLWVIGTGKPADPAHAQAVMDFILSFMPQVRVIYGGSVDSSNASEFAGSRIQGVLVGGASLKTTEFHKIISAFTKF